MGFYQDKLDYYFRNHLDEDLKPRIKSYIKEEPSTLEWIESYNSNSIFYDIGSNIGGYSIISIINHPKIKVYSFEPNFINFYIQASVCKDNKIKNLFPLI